MPRLASLFLPQLAIERIVRAESGSRRESKALPHQGEGERLRREDVNRTVVRLSQGPIMPRVRTHVERAQSGRTRYKSKRGARRSLDPRTKSEDDTEYLALPSLLAVS